MNHEYLFEFKRIILKPLKEEDIECLRLLRNQEKQYFITNDEISEESQKKWYQSYLNKEDDIMFKIVKREKPEEFIGAIALYDIDLEKRVSEFGRVLVDKMKAPEKGIGKEATLAVCLFGFEVLKLNKIIGEILKSNERIIKVDRRAGFRFVGEQRDVYNIEMTKDTICLDN